MQSGPAVIAVVSVTMQPVLRHARDRVPHELVRFHGMKRFCLYGDSNAIVDRRGKAALTTHRPP
eukprot:scaffold192759_cov37-Prasinocladus_malaysianus.AAC.1